MLYAQMRCECVVLVEEAGEDCCRLSVSGSIDVDLPVIGSQAEQLVMEAVVNHHRMLPHIFERCGGLHSWFTLAVQAA